MAKLNDPPHPNALAARMRPEALRLTSDPIAARERRDEIVALREAGVSVIDIAKRYGICRSRVNQLLWRAKKESAKCQS